jgi:hypothetical protein
MKKKKQKIKKIKKTFGEILRDRLSDISEGSIESGCLGDGSGCWVQVRIKDKALNLSLDPTRSYLTGIGLYEDVVQVVDQKLLFKISNG